MKLAGGKSKCHNSPDVVQMASFDIEQSSNEPGVGRSRGGYQVESEEIDEEMEDSLKFRKKKPNNRKSSGEISGESGLKKED